MKICLKKLKTKLTGLVSPGNEAAINSGLAIEPNEDPLDQKTHSQVQLRLVPCPGQSTWISR